MKLSMQLAGILVVAVLNLPAAHDPRPADVMVYVEGSDVPPSPIDYGARNIVTGMYARIGVSLAWSSDNQGRYPISGSAVSIHLRYAPEGFARHEPDALAFARPFAGRGDSITVMFDRIRMAAGGSARARPILAHVLAHEIGHMLEGTIEHARTGVMKSHWSVLDFNAMQQAPLEFTKDDTELIARRLAARKARRECSSAATPLYTRAH